MEERYPDSALKPIINRVRHLHRKPTKKRKCHPCDKTEDSTGCPSLPKRKCTTASVTIENTTGENLRAFVSSCIQDLDLARVAELKEELNVYVRENMCPLTVSADPTDAWLSKLDSDDMNYLMSIMDPVTASLETIMTLPNTLNKMYDVSSLEIQPTIYHRDHMWLSLQWTIDEVKNPFLSRPCMSKPCLGEYVSNSASQESCPLPEMVPVALLDKMREYMAQGHSMESFHQLLKDRRLSARHVASDFCLGRDVWAEPKCILCYMQENFSLATCQGFGEKQEISLETYKKTKLVQFDGMRQDIMVNFDQLGVTWKLKETGVLLPKIALPLPSCVVSLLKRMPNGEINIDALYVNENKIK